MWILEMFVFTQAGSFFMGSTLFKTLFVDESVRDYPLVGEFQSKLDLPVVYVEHINEVYRIVNQSEDPVTEGKKHIVLTRNKSQFLKKCPGTAQYTCCGYKILHIGSYCFMDCSYCILQAFFHPPVLQFFVNTGDMFDELDRYFVQPGISRIGTGEYTDSLIWDRWAGVSEQLVQRFAAQDRAVLELKTKTTSVKHIEHLEHNRKTIMAWSLNTERVIRTDERRTSTLDARLKAARQCQDWGYPLAFHFDPIVIYEGCEAEYIQVIERLFSEISPDSVVYISLGTFRFIPLLKRIIQKRFEDSDIVYGEFITGLDGKMRYFKPLRIRVCKAIYEAIRKMAPSVTVYYCMESETVWRETMGFYPGEDGLSGLLDQSVAKHCGVKP